MEIRDGGYEASVSPESGAALLSLRRGDFQILRKARPLNAALDDPREASCFPCAPWFGRLYNGLQFNGNSWPVAPTLPVADPGHALHGYGWVRPWRVCETDNASVLLEMEYTPFEGGFPFKFSSSLMYRLSDDGMHVRLTVLNTDTKPMPAGLGLHPYFERTAGTQICFNAGSFWSPPADGGNGSESSIPDDVDYSAPKALPNETIDHSFAGFDGNIVIAQGDRRITLTCDAPILHLYAPKSEDYFCLEPITHLPGRFGLDQLPPGKKMSIEMKISAN